MADFKMGIFSDALNCAFLYGFFGGISIAWLFFKSRSKILAKDAAFCSDNSSVCGEVSYKDYAFQGTNLRLMLRVIVNCLVSALWRW
jgi:hypothetical protein